jgi:uncharacterized membrane protein YphA (DoxX/SURF4 family)
MDSKTNTNRAIGVLIMRLILGFIFFYQGAGKLYHIGFENVYSGFFMESYQDVLPEPLIWLTAVFTTYAELICGMFVVIGLFKKWNYIVLGLILVVVTIGHGMLEPIWGLEHVMYRAIFLIALLLLPVTWDRFSLDYLIWDRKK